MICANQLVALRALAQLEQTGPIEGHDYLPLQIFTVQHFSIAANVMLITTGCILVSALWRGAPNASPPSLSPLPRLFLPILLTYYAISALSSKTILQRSYENEAWTLSGVNLGGLNALLHSLFLYELFRRVHARRVTPWKAFALVGSVFFFTDYIKGTTGLATGFVLTAAMLASSFEPTARRRFARAGIALTSIFVLVFVIRTVRQSIHASSPQEAMEAVGETLSDLASRPDSTASENDNGVQYAEHLLECIELYRTGNARDWRSIYNPLIYTFEPSFLLEPLGITRPREAAWELADHFIQGGGIYVAGELYWNGGYLCVLLVFAFLALWAYWCDTRYRSSAAWFVCLLTFAPGCLQGFGYGFAQVARGIMNALWILIGLALLKRVRKGSLTRDSAPRPRPLGAPSSDNPVRKPLQISN